jgi:hypothetical protein
VAPTPAAAGSASATVLQRIGRWHPTVKTPSVKPCPPAATASRPIVAENVDVAVKMSPRFAASEEQRDAVNQSFAGGRRFVYLRSPSRQFMRFQTKFSPILPSEFQASGACTGGVRVVGIEIDV